MTHNKALERMKQGQAAIGVVATLGVPLAVEMMSQAGFDFVLVDGQHVRSVKILLAPTAQTTAPLESRNGGSGSVGGSVLEADSPIFPAGRAGQSPSYSSAGP